MLLFTIGHSNHPFDKFVGLLQASGIKTLMDVRSKPFSRWNPHFNRSYLERELPKHEIQYVFAGDSLGGRPTDPTCYKSGTLPRAKAAKSAKKAKSVKYVQEVDYAEVMKREWFVNGVTHLLELAAVQPTAIMCAEEDPAHCHRHHLITAYLWREHRQADVFHIRGDGQVERAEASDDKGTSEQPQLL